MCPAEQATGADGPQRRLCGQFLTFSPVGRSSPAALGGWLQAAGIHRGQFATRCTMSTDHAQRTIRPLQPADAAAVVAVWHRAGMAAYPFLPTWQAFTLEQARGRTWWRGRSMNVTDAGPSHSAAVRRPSRRPMWRTIGVLSSHSTSGGADVIRHTAGGRTKTTGQVSGRWPVPDRAQQGGAGDGKQRPLVPRSRSLPRLTPGVRLCWKGGYIAIRHMTATLKEQQSACWWNLRLA
jgi:hypothetical protein